MTTSPVLVRGSEIASLLRVSAHVDSSLADAQLWLPVTVR